jgi:hypothetical protein
VGPAVLYDPINLRGTRFEIPHITSYGIDS